MCILPVTHTHAHIGKNQLYNFQNYFNLKTTTKMQQ